ncbi:hypothetical protein ACERK3_07980 [Phycisphaerales bacterium AB-hyl4]|uniref:Uncharacterized protein n=1 Tax=Natronomicrosphaera hydrolytica TaxID=3242702 RepID=A0ABV4U5M7_9BACT
MNQSHHKPPQRPRSDASCRDNDRPHCPVCGSPGVEKKQKWFCQRCGLLLATCCN